MPIGKWLRPAALPSACLALFLLTLACIQRTHGQWADESVHVPQIENFLHGRFVVHPWLTTIPGYHLLMAGILKLLGLDSLSSMRAINAAFGLAPAALFYWIRKTLGDAQAPWRAAAMLFMPLIFPYDFLIYTDILSLALVLGALLATLNRRHVVAAAILVVAILVRQNNVAWAGFMPLLVLWPSLQENKWQPWRCWKEIIRTAWPYALPVAVFVGYWAWNGTISLSKVVAGGHPDWGFHLGNVYFSLFLYVLFFPYPFWVGLKRFATILRASPWLLVILLLAIAYLKLRGNPDNDAAPEYFLRNSFIAFVHHGWPRRAFGLLVALAGCALAFTRFLLPQGWLIYPFAAFYLCSSWLIENRYAIIPFALWMALRKVEDERAERWTLAAWIAVSLCFVAVIFTGKFML
jgi:hypothetical protein